MVEIKFVWNEKGKVILVIIGVTGTNSESLRQYLSNISGKHEIKELQKRPYSTPHTNYGKFYCKSTKVLS